MGRYFTEIGFLTRRQWSTLETNLTIGPLRLLQLQRRLFFYQDSNLKVLQPKEWYQF